jgi:hypothetical protein
MSRGIIRLEEYSGGQVEGLVGAELHALAWAPPEFLAEVGADLIQAVPAVARLEFPGTVVRWQQRHLPGG